MNKNVIGIVAVVLVGGAVFLAYKMSVKGNLRLARQIIKDGNFSGGEVALAQFDEPFLKEWAKASRRRNQTFTYLGKVYNTIGGKAVR